MNYEQYNELNEIKDSLDFLKLAIDSAKNNCKTRLSNLIDSGEIDKLQDEQQLIQLIIRYESIYNLFTSDSTEIPNRADFSVIKTEKEHYTLNDNLTNKKPVSFKFLEDVKYIDSWRSFTEKICDELCKYDSKKFLEIVDLKILNGTHTKYFSLENDILKNPYVIEVEGQKIYIDISKLTSNGFLFTKKLIRFFGLDINKVQINIDSQFRRKVRECKPKNS